MKKSTIATMIATLCLCASVIFTGCTSVPEPKNTEDNLLYGNVYFNFSCIPNNYGIPESSTKKDGIEVKFQNIKTKRIITMTTNYKGEFMRKNIPSGTYIIYSLKSKVNYGNGYEIVYEAKFDKYKTTNFHFMPLSNSVVNLGIIDLDISMNDINYYNWRVEWDKDFSDSYIKFCSEHENSGWINKNWYTRAESLE